MKKFFGVLSLIAILMVAFSSNAAAKVEKPSVEYEHFVPIEVENVVSMNFEAVISHDKEVYVSEPPSEVMVDYKKIVAGVSDENDVIRYKGKKIPIIVSSAYTTNIQLHKRGIPINKRKK